MPPSEHSSVSNDLSLQQSYVSDAIDSILKSIVDGNDEPLVKTDKKEMNRCTAELQSFISEPVDHEINMHLLSWDLLVMASTDGKENQKGVSPGRRDACKRSWGMHANKYADLCSLEERSEMLSPRKRLKSFEDTSSFGHDDSLPTMDPFCSKEWGYFIEARE